MEIHKPKAVHGWRELVNEIGVIVIGVLIALGAEQSVEALHWRHQIEVGEEALRDDARDVIYTAAEREAMSPCLGRRLSAIASMVDAASASGQLPPIGQLGAPSGRLFAFTSWNGLVSAQLATHLPRERLLAYGRLATAADLTAQENRAEFAAWTGLYTIVGPGRQFGDAEQAAVRAALSTAVLLGKHMRSDAHTLTNDIATAGLLSGDEIASIRKKAARDYAVSARDGIMCKPLAEAPSAATYGQAPSPIDLAKPFQP